MIAQFNDCVQAISGRSSNKKRFFSFGSGGVGRRDGLRRCRAYLQKIREKVEKDVYRSRQLFDYASEKS
jgi:hypothetical protein